MLCLLPLSHVEDSSEINFMETKIYELDPVWKELGLLSMAETQSQVTGLCRAARQPQGIYLSFHNCNLTVSKCTLKGHLSVSDLSCEPAVMVKGLCGEPPQGANVENYLLTICPVIFSARPPSLVRQLQLPLLSHCCSIGRAASGRIGFPSR